MIAEVCINNSPTPVYICRNKAGVLKFTKTSIRVLIDEHKKRIQTEDAQILELKMFIHQLFPNQTIFKM